jgi:hypothetical protein
MKALIELELFPDGEWRPGDKEALEKEILNLLPSFFDIEEDRLCVLSESASCEIVDMNRPIGDG